MNTKVQAHRGASAYRPENTLEAFGLAVEQKADAIELDVHLTKDGQIVVAHDERVERVSDGEGFISDMTLAELKRLNFGKLFPGSVCRIPLLSEVFELVKPTPLCLNIELKTNVRLYPALPAKLLSLVGEHKMKDRVLFSSFNHYSLLAVKELKKTAKTGLLYNMGMVDPWVYAKHVGADAIHPHYFVIAALPETVARCHEHGVAVNVWTADEEEVIALMLKCGVDGIITNRPDAALACRAASKEESAR